MEREREILLATLKAYRAVQKSSWPNLNPGIEARETLWDNMSVGELRAELDRLVGETNRPGCEVRIFWKMGPDFNYAGINDNLVRDAGFQTPQQILGKNDFLEGIVWLRQSSKYRADDLEVVKTAAEKLNIVERQRSANGNIWLRTGKAPIRPDGGTPVGILGMYEVIDVETAMRLNPQLR
jgi:hypothetical protein